MKKYLWVGGWLFCLIVAHSGYALSQDRIKAPRLVLSEEVYDFGEIREGERIAHDFIVTNSGSAPLEIKKVSPG